MRAALVATAFLAGNACWAESDILRMTPDERTAFRAEVRALLLDDPGIVDHALNPPSPAAQQMRQEIEDDQQLLNALAPEILSGRQIALFVGPDCAECDRAAEELASVAADLGTTFVLHDTGDGPAAALAARLGMDDLPFYVLADMILRGHIPQVVLPRYLD